MPLANHISAFLPAQVNSSSPGLNSYLWDLLRQGKFFLHRDRAFLERTLLICGLDLLAEIDCSLENSDVLVELYLQIDIGAFFDVFA